MMQAKGMMQQHAARLMQEMGKLKTYKAGLILQIWDTNYYKQYTDSHPSSSHPTALAA